MSKLISNFKVYCSDVDDTLVMHDLSEYPSDTQITVEYTNGPMKLVPNKKHINLLVKFYKLGYHVIVWSRTGGDWAEIVSKAIGIDQYVNQYITKPLFIADDRKPEEWLTLLYRGE